MTNTKKNSVKKRLISAVAMLTISAVTLSTATYAWFTMNRDVTVTGLQTTAKAEEGLVIAAYTSNGTVAPVDAAFADTAAAYNTNSEQTLLPTFTTDAVTWYHHTSTKSNDGQAYASGTAATVTNGSGASDPYYYEMNKFDIKSYGAVSGSTAATQAVYVKDVQVQSRTAQAYDPSLRVLIKTSDHTLIFAQDGAATSSSQSTFKLLGSDSTKYTLTQENTAAAKIIDAASTTATPVEIYMYYDGEDPACKSDNIADFTAMTVNVTFTTDTPA